MDDSLNFKVSLIEVPKIKDKYKTDFRTVRFSGEFDDTYLIIECFMGGTDISLDDKVKVLIKPIKECDDADSLIKEGWTYRETCQIWRNYLCVSSHQERNDKFYLTKFYRESTESKPYSIISCKTKEKFEVGGYYGFFYKRVE